jgi:tetratricopeptide (TPR) repeat protein
MTKEPPAAAPRAQSAPALREPVVETRSERVVNWFKKHPQLTTWAVVIVVVGAGLFIWNRSATSRSEAEARSSLQGARVSFESHNYGFASSELQRVRENYSGTKAAEEATLLLAQVRIGQHQNDQAVQLLQEFAPSASRDYRSQAYSLLGASLENAGRPAEAAPAYETSAESALLPFLKAQALADAGRSWVAAGDTARAVAAYRRIATELKETGPATEAQVRIGELTKGALSP